MVRQQKLLTRVVKDVSVVVAAGICLVRSEFVVPVRGVVEVAATVWEEPCTGVGARRCRSISAYAVPLPLPSQGGFCCGSSRVWRYTFVCAVRGAN